MSTVQFRNPHSILNHTTLPPPIHSSLLSGISEQSRIRFVIRNEGVTSECFRWLHYDLLRRRRTMISVTCTSSPERTLSGYIESEIINALVALVNGLRRNPQYPVLHYQIKVDPNDSLLVTEVQFLGEFATNGLKLPVFFFFPHLSLQKDVETEELSLPISTSLGRALSSLHPFPQGNRIVVSDFTTTVLISDVDEKLNTAVCEVTLSQSHSLRFILASYIREALPPDYFDLDIEDFFIPQGAPNNPALPLPLDDEILSASHRHSDFDRYTLVNSQSAVDQFFRWKASMCAEPIPVLVGEVAQVESHGFMPRCTPFQPRYPLEPLPKSTRAHLLATARRSFPQFVQLLNRSRSFNLVLDEELTPSEGTGYARTFSCRLIEVDGQLPSDDVPEKLCVKLFDDRTASVPSPKEYSSLKSWSQDFYTAEDMIQNEINAYMRLEHAWGTTVPYFYGAHRFMLQDGRHRFGILMEYVTKSERKLDEHSDVAQIAFIQSARHAVRVLQYADISQHDWSTEQWICTPSPSYTESNPALTCVLIDFSLTSQGDRYSDAYKGDDYGAVADMMCEAGIPPDLIRQWFGPREEWDFFLSSSVMDRAGGFT